MHTSRSTLFAAQEQLKRFLSGSMLSSLRILGLILNRGIRYLWRVLFGNRTFKLGDRIYNYRLHPFILDNERAVEIPLALRLVEKHRGHRILEVGHVLSAYARFDHAVVDKYEKASGVINADITDFQPAQMYDLILCLSTLEHVGWDETPRDESKIPRAMAAMAAMLAPGGEMLVTMPLGYNRAMDRMLEVGDLTFTERYFLKRVSKTNQWIEAQWTEVRDANYGTPFACANAIVVGWVRK